MKSVIPIRSFFGILMLLVIIPSLKGQDDSRRDYVPEVGQQGKDVVWVPTPQELVDTMLSIAELTPSDLVIDLGSGDGRTVITAAKRGARAIGIEFNPDMVTLSRRNAEKEGVSSQVQFFEGDLFEYDLSKATVITMFLLPEINLKLRPRLLELKPGTRVVSNTFTMGEWIPDLEVNTPDRWNSWTTALMWIIPAKVEGRWKIGEHELSLTQKYQFINGTFNNGGTITAIADGRLRGNEISFKIGNIIYLGQVNGSRITGTAKSNSAKWDWTAVKSSE